MGLDSHTEDPRTLVQKDPLVSVGFSEQQDGGIKTSGVGSVRSIELAHTQCQEPPPLSSLPEDDVILLRTGFIFKVTTYSIFCAMLQKNSLYTGSWIHPFSLFGFSVHTDGEAEI